MAENNQPKIPPHNTDAEASLLGSLLIDADAIVKIADIVGENDFYDERHGKIYQAIRSLYDGHKPIDVLTLSNSLKNNEQLDGVGGSQYLTELTNFVPSASHVVEYAQIVSTKALRRRSSRLVKR